MNEKWFTIPVRALHRLADDAADKITLLVLINRRAKQILKGFDDLRLVRFIVLKKPKSDQSTKILPRQLKIKEVVEE